MCVRSRHVFDERNDFRKWFFTAGVVELTECGYSIAPHYENTSPPLRIVDM
jgi:hypothetical protein